MMRDMTDEEWPLAVINGLNIPVCIAVERATDDDFEPMPGDQWELRAECYLPRKSRVEQSAWHFSGTEAEMRNLVRDHILPHYERAVKALREIADGKRDDLYFWPEESKS